MNVVAAVDCGATSVRTCRVDLEAASLVPEVVHRVPHAPVRNDAGHLRWDWRSIVSAVHDGLERCLDIGPLSSIGIDTWAVDYGLLDDNGDLLGDPYSYRDHRTADYLDIVDAFGAEEMYGINGLQLQPFNTLFQLARHDRAELDRASRLLWLPELLVHELTGIAVTERTSAGSSGLVDLATGDWSPELVEVTGAERPLLGTIESAGRIVGTWRDIPVALVAGHDTASAVAGMAPASSGASAFVATGTWMLAGMERPVPDTSEWARDRNFTNEAGALGGFRFLRNVTGFWILEQCRSHWNGIDLDTLVRDSDAIEGDVPIVDVDHRDLRAPDDMLTTYTQLARLPRSSSPGVVTRSIVESIAAATATALRQLAEVTGVDDVVLFGGAARNATLVESVERRAELPVRVGSSEAAALGNAIVQGITIGAFDSLDDGRSHIPTH